MAKAAGTGLNLSKNLSIVVLLSCLGSKLAANAASLCYSFTVGKSGSGPWWNKVQGQLNKETFIYCDSKNNCHAIGVLGNKLSGTEIWTPQVNVLKDAVDLFKAEVVTMREPLTLQATMHCGHDVNGRFRGSWDFGLNGHKMLHVDLSTGKLTEVDPASRRMKEMLEKNRDLATFLKLISQGDCRTWLEEFRLYWKEKLEPTDSPTATPAVGQASSMAIKPNAYGLLIMFTYSLLLLI